MAPTTQRDEIPPGTLDMLILKTLAPGDELHGFAIADAILQPPCALLSPDGERQKAPGARDRDLSTCRTGDFAHSQPRLT